MLTDNIRSALYKWVNPSTNDPPLQELLNPSNINQIIDEVGGIAWQDVLGKLEAIYHAQRRFSRYSMGSSLIVRDEAEIHGISLPRFAIRAHLNGNGFVNLRRLELFRNMVSGPLRNEYVGDQEENAEKQMVDGAPAVLPINGMNHKLLSAYTWGDVLLNETRSPVADCVLPPPDQFHKGFNFLRAELGTAYGEKPTYGIPWVQMMAHFGGAVCIQSCMFVCSLILSRSGSSTDNTVVTPATVGLPGELSKGGFHPFCGMLSDKIAQHLASTGYCVADQPVSHSALSLANHLADYIDAQLPIIYSVDSRSLWSVTGGSRPRSERQQKANKNNHAVVVVGVSLDRRRFLINDPSVLPFASLSETELFDSSKDSQHWVIYPPEVQVGMHEALYYWPERGEPSSNRRLGIYEIARVIQNHAPDVFGTSTPAPQHFGQFFLVRVRSTKKRLRLQLPNGLDAPKEAMGVFQIVDSFIDDLSDSFLGKWVWVHVQNEPQNISVWLAEKAIDLRELHPHPDDVRRVIETRLVAVLRYSHAKGKMRIDNRLFPDRKQGNKEQSSGIAVRERRITVDATPSVVPGVSLISSFCASGIVPAVQAWPYVQTNNCELYTFMQGDADVLGFSRRDAPIDWLSAEIYHTSHDALHSFAETLADRVLAKLAENGVRPPQIRAFATFFPEITRRGTSRAKRALCALVEFARSLKRRDHDVRTIEVVCGGRIEGLYPYANRDEIVCIAKFRPEPNEVKDDRPHPMVEALADVIDMTKLSPEESITITAELEPGDLFSMRSIDGIRHFVDAINAHGKRDSLRSIVALNVDVGHYSLAGISPAGIAPEIIDHIAHFHFSHHLGGHLADLSLCSIDSESRRRCAEWVEFIRRCYATRQKNHFLPLSKTVSLEMELATNLVDLRNSLQRLNEWFPSST